MFLKRTALCMAVLALCLMVTSYHAYASADGGQPVSIGQPILQADPSRNESSADTPPPMTDEGRTTPDNQSTDAEEQKPETDKQSGGSADSD